MTDIIICGTTIKERALLEYNNIHFTILENTNFPLKDIKVCSLQSVSSIMSILERLRKITHENIAVLTDEIDKDLITI